MDKEGSKPVEIVACDDKRQITSVFAGFLSGEMLLPQLIYKGTTERCLPCIEFPKEWHITYSINHWANESTMVDYIEKILCPYIARKRSELNLDDTHPALVIFDSFKAQTTERVLKLLEDNYIYSIMVPANCTDRLQPMDISVNKAAKHFLREQFTPTRC